MSQAQIISDLKKRMEGAVHALEKDLGGLRTGRASTSLLEGVVVEVYGAKMPIDQVATVSVAESRLLSVQVWDQGNAAAVEKAITNANLGLNPSASGALIRVPIPDLNEERRREMVKIAAQYAEKARVSVRNVRRDGMDALKKLEKDGEISKDEQHDEAESVQKVTDEFVKKIDDALAHKEKDIMEV